MSADTAVPVRAPEPRRAPAGGAARRRERVREALRRALPALVLYAAARLAGVATMASWAWSTGRHPRTLLGHSWDAIWYAGIAEDGYGLILPSPTSHSVIYSDYAFFPLFPGLVHALTALIPISIVSAQLVVAWTAAACAAWGIYAVGERLYGRRAATWLVLLWGLLPHSIVQTMGYTESLMTALAAWALYAVVTRRHLWAGALALVAGLSRPNAVAVAAAVGCATLAVLRREPRSRADWRLWTGLALAPLGWAGYVLWAGYRSGFGPLGYFTVQRRWGSRFDFGADAFRFVRHLFTGRDGMAYYGSLGVLVVALVALVFLVLERPPAPLLAYTLVLCVIALGGSSYFASKPRFLLPAFPLLIPLALGMTRARSRTVAVTVGALAGLSFVYGTYLVTAARLPM
ncbi:hypothetical protein ACH4PU_06950 [Streptomyces sp. NPDC021100]|uniref:hypothetical protein n=1 Tax=Streptomyces sp. NPDC021100 TaxID=3365114 RepID=UPI0037B9F73F